MSMSGGGDPSFDPRTWTNGGEDATAAKAGGDAPGPSFDPKTWVGKLPPAGEPPASDKPGQTMDRRRLAAGAVIALLLGGAALFASLNRGRRRGRTRVLASSPAPPPAGDRRALVLARPSDIEGALTGAGAAPEQAQAAAAAAVARLGPVPSELHVVFFLKPGPAPADLMELEVRRPDGTGVLVARSGSGFSAHAAEANLTVQVKDVRGEMDAYDVYSSAVSAGVPDSLIHDFAQAFTFDFDFQREITRGDIFEAVFEQRQNSSGEAVGQPRLLFALLTTQAKSVALYQFAAPGQPPGWFDGDGRSIIRAFMRTPVEGARISSTFGMREHPVLGFMKLHKGVDFAAPVGTPIYAAGDGLVQHAEFKELNGNYVEILHDNGWQTIYLHMSAFGPGIAPGVRVHQGQTIGMVGTTGRSTGPHLHYEMHINNEPVDPMSIPLPSGPVLDAAALRSFVAERNRIDALRAQQT
jgi:murein DD-endopeptidase MepM/ murein hydrolase activator NlpD